MILSLFDLLDISGGKKRAPPKAEKLVDFHKDIVKKAVAKYPEHPLILAGKSMGSRYNIQPLEFSVFFFFFFKK